MLNSFFFPILLSCIFIWIYLEWEKRKEKYGKTNEIVIDVFFYSNLIIASKKI